jgi:uncharacterized membrane protein YdjX (TVP38/TMEM64 family)
MRLLLLFLGLAAIVLIIFFIWGESFVAVFSHEGSIRWLGAYGNWAWAFGVVLLMGDILLPLPATLIMSAIGFIYGPFLGGLISSGGSFLAGAAGYWLCRIIGEGAAKKLLGEKDFERGVNLGKGEIGTWVVVLSRWLPVFPEVVACMAGLARMPATRFHVALLCGSLPMGFTYAYIGHAGVTDPWFAILFSAGLPPLIWFTVHSVLKKRRVI